MSGFGKRSFIGGAVERTNKTKAIDTGNDVYTIEEGKIFLNGLYTGMVIKTFQDNSKLSWFGFRAEHEDFKYFWTNVFKFVDMISSDYISHTGSNARRKGITHIRFWVIITFNHKLNKVRYEIENK